FAFYSGNNLYHYQLVAGALESRGSFSATQRILSVQADRSGWWLQLADGRWIAVQDNQQTALWLRPQQLQVAPQFVGYLADNGVYTRELITQSVAGPVVTQTLAATGYLLRAERALTLAAYTQNGEQLTLFRQGSAEWLLPYVQNLTQIELSYTDVTGEGKVLLALDQPVAAGTVNVAPASATLAVNGQVPVTLTPAADSQLVLLNAQNGVPLAPVADLGWQQWLSVIAQNDLSWTMDGNNLSASWSGTDNQSQGRIDILSPENNSAVQESEAVQVRFTSKGFADVRYSRVVLEDFNGVIVREVFLDGAAGDVSLTMPPLTLAANYYVRIQTYFGDQLNYSESRVALRAVPKSSQVSAAVNVPLFVAAGAQLQLQRDSSAQVATGLLLLENEQGDV